MKSLYMYVQPVAGVTSVLIEVLDLLIIYLYEGTVSRHCDPLHCLQLLILADEWILPDLVELCSAVMKV